MRTACASYAVKAKPFGWPTASLDSGRWAVRDAPKGKWVTLHAYGAQEAVYGYFSDQEGFPCLFQKKAI